MNKRLILLVTASCLFAASHLFALTIPIDLGPTGVVRPIDPGWVTSTPFAQFNGTPLSGQTIEMNFSFGSEFVRLFSVSSQDFGFVAVLFTSATIVPQVLSGSGFGLDQQGNAISPLGFFHAGSGSINDPQHPAVFMSLQPLQNGPLPPLDLFGATFSVTLPNEPAVTITSAEFALSDGFNNAGAVAPFGIGPGRIPVDIVPDTGSTLALFAIALLALAGIKRKGSIVPGPEE
jgi:hypothetical protein